MGEDLAFQTIKAMGYRKIIKNYRCALGEIDLIAQDGETLVFLEIKTRRTGPTAYAKEALTQRKKRQISRVALAYMKAAHCCDVRARFDVVAVSLFQGHPQVEVIKNAFDLSC
jgi:putative endonuclease